MKLTYRQKKTNSQAFIVSNSIFLKLLKQIIKAILFYKIEILGIIKDIILNKNSRREWFYNKIHFYYFVYFNGIEFFFQVGKKKLKQNSNKIIKKYSNSLQHAPLLRAKKLLNRVNKNSNYHFIDVGSGLGILLFFVSVKYNFQSYQGIEINKDIYEKSIKNLKKINLKKKVVIKNISADKFVLDQNKKYIIYFYNPFHNFILNKFLKNNSKIIKKSKSIILFQNDNTGNIFKKYNFNKKTIDQKTTNQKIIDNRLSIYFS